MENSIEEDIETIKYNMKIIKNVMNNFEDELCEKMQMKTDEVNKAIEHLLSDYKKLQEEFEQVDHECERLEEKEVRLIKENEYYKDLINALETYYEITREDLERCIRNDK